MRIEHFEQVTQPAAKVRPVGRCPPLDQVVELIAIVEDAGVIGEQDEQQPDEQQFEVMPAVARLGQRFMQLAHQL